MNTCVGEREEEERRGRVEEGEEGGRKAEKQRGGECMNMHR